MAKSNNISTVFKSLTPDQQLQVRQFIDTLKTNKSLLQHNLDLLKELPSNIDANTFSDLVADHPRFIKFMTAMNLLCNHFISLAAFFAITSIGEDDEETHLQQIITNINSTVDQIESIFNTNHFKPMILEACFYEDLLYVSFGDSIILKCTALYIILIFFRLKNLFDSEKLTEIQSNRNTSTNSLIVKTISIHLESYSRFESKFQFNTKQNTFSEDIAKVILCTIIPKIHDIILHFINKL